MRWVVVACVLLVLLAGCNGPQRVTPSPTTTTAPPTTTPPPDPFPPVPPDCETQVFDVPGHVRENGRFNVTLRFACYDDVHLVTPFVRVQPMRASDTPLPDVSSNCQPSALEVGTGLQNFTCAIGDPGRYLVSGGLRVTPAKGDNRTEYRGAAFLTTVLPATTPEPIAHRPRVRLLDVPADYRVGEPLGVRITTDNVLFSPVANHTVGLWLGEDALLPIDAQGCRQARLQPGVNALSCDPPEGTTHLRVYIHLASGGNGTRYWSDFVQVGPSPVEDPLDCEPKTDRFPATQRARSGFDFRVPYTCDQQELVRAWSTSVRVHLRSESGGEPLHKSAECQSVRRENASRLSVWNCNLLLIGVYDVRPVLRAATDEGPFIVAGPARVITVTRADMPELPTTQPAVQLFDVPSEYQRDQPFSFQGSVNWRSNIPPANFTLGAWMGAALPADPLPCGPVVPQPATIVPLECASRGDTLRAFVRVGGTDGAVHWSDPAPVRSIG